MSYIVCPLLKRYVTGDAAMIIQCLKYVLKSAVIKFALLHCTYTQLQLDTKDSSNANTSKLQIDHLLFQVASFSEKSERDNNATKK